MKIVVIGGGPAGYEAAACAAGRGAEVTLVEKEKIGGTCLNRGCIPTKSYLKSAKDHLKEDRPFDFLPVLERKNTVVSGLREGVLAKLSRAGVKILEGEARLNGPHAVEVRTQDGTERMEADGIILASGSETFVPDVFRRDSARVIDSDGLLALDTLPPSIIIVGGGVIGCEAGQFLSRFGVKVTIIEAMKTLLPEEDPDTGKLLARAFKKEGLKVITGKPVEAVDVEEDRVSVILKGGKTVSADTLLVAIGRKPVTENLGLESAGIETDEKGFIPVDEKMYTGKGKIYAVGDIVRGSMLAHTAIHEGLAAAENLTGANRSAKDLVTPRCVYTDPEVSTVGATEKELESGYKVREAQFRGNGKARCGGTIDGRVKLITDLDDRLVGAQITGPHASDLIGELTLAVSEKLPVDILEHLVHPHPSLSEVIWEAARSEPKVV